MSQFETILDQLASGYTDMRPEEAARQRSNFAKAPRIEAGGRGGYRTCYEAEGFRARVHGQDDTANPYASHPYRAFAALQWRDGWNLADAEFGDD